MANKITTLFDFKEQGSGLSRIKADIQGVDGAWSKAKTGFKSAIKEFRSSNAAQGAAVAGLGAAAYKAIGYASELEESVNAVTVTYGDNAEAVLAIGENAAKSFGMSKAEFNGFAVQFSAFAKQVAERDGRQVSDVINEMTTRVADFASVMNLDLNTAAQVFMSTMSGETEPIRRFGKDVSAAAVEAYALANGLIETKSELTESIKVQARYGLLMEQTADTAGDFANTSDSLANSQRIAAAQAKDLAADMGETLAPALATVVTGLSEMLEVLDQLKVTDAISLGWVEDVGTTLGKVLSPWNKQAREANEAIVKAFESAESAAKSFDMTLLDGAGTFADARARALDYAEGVDEIGDKAHFANLVALEWNETNEEAVEAQRQAKLATADHTKAMSAVEDAIDDAKVATKEKAEADRLAEAAARRHLNEIRHIKDEFSALKAELSDRSAYLDIADAFDAIEDATARATEAQKEHGDGSREHEQALRDLERAQMDLTTRVMEYEEEVGGLPDVVTTEILAMIEEGRLAEAEAALARLERARTINYIPVVQPPRTPGGYRMSAGGTNFSPGGATLVGENGPELVRLPTGSQVVPNGRTQQMVEGSGFPDSITLVIEGQPFKAMLAERDRQLLGELRQGRRG